MNITSIGPVTKSRRDEVKDLRDSLGHDNYNETLGYLLATHTKYIDQNGKQSDT